MNLLQNNVTHFLGTELVNKASELSFKTDSPRCIIQGRDRNNLPVSLPMDDAAFSKHALFLGNIGTGKTNAISQVMAQIKRQLTPDDLMIVFDTKGDFYQQFFSAGDIVISNRNSQFQGTSDYWNVFSEIMIDGPESIYENTLEIAANLFEDKISKSNAPFFPQAAKDMLATFLYVVASRMSKNAQHNKDVWAYFKDTTQDELIKFFSDNQQWRINSYIAKDAGAQSAGVISELQQLLNEIFIGDFRQKGNMSIRDLVRQKGGKTIFLEYDISVGKVLTPIYSLLLDLAIKEVLSSSQRKKSKGNVWFFIDEFSLLPNLQFLDNGINFGRSQGAKFIIGVQNIAQIYHEYGEHLGQSILSGLRTVFSFHVDDIKSREFIQNRYGYAQKKVSYSDAQGSTVINVTPMKVIEDWQVSSLGLGEAIVGLPEGNPFILQFDAYKQ